jgi:lipoprotein-releasing system permease protein
MAFEYFIGIRYLKAKQTEAFISLTTLLSIAGVSVGVMALIVVIGVMSGFESDLKSRILGVESHLIITRRSGPMDTPGAVLDVIRQIAGVKAAFPFVASQFMLRSASAATGALLKGIDPNSADASVRNFDPRALDVGAPKAGNDRHWPGIVLGNALARHLAVTAGDAVYVISPRGMLSPIGHVPAMRKFTVVGTFSSGIYEYDGTRAYIHLDEARRLLNLADAVTGVDVLASDIFAAGEIGRQVLAQLKGDYTARDWMQMNKNLFSALKLEKAVMFVILALIVLVAAFNITSTLTMRVMEKTRDIAILKVMGATDRSIRKIFAVNGVIIGTIGTAIGASLGLLLCSLLKRYRFIELPVDMFYIATLPVRLQWVDVLVIVASALAICFLATLFPSRQAARLDPAEAIRYG